MSDRSEKPLPYEQTRPHAAPAVYNDPGHDSLFVKLSDEDNRCSICGEVTSNNTEGRDAHLNRAGCHVGGKREHG